MLAKRYLSFFAFFVISFEKIWLYHYMYNYLWRDRKTNNVVASRNKVYYIFIGLRNYFFALDDQTRRINNNYIATWNHGVEKCLLGAGRNNDRSSFPLDRFVNIKGERSGSINSIINVRELSLHEYQRDTLLSSCNSTLHAGGCVI